MGDTLYGQCSCRARDSRWLALIALCVAQLMIFLDATVVNVALPSIQRQLRFSQASLSWVVNAYLLTFGGFLLLSGRLGDVFGRRRIFVAGLLAFVAASVACAAAGSRTALLLARAAQGLGGAVVSAVGLSMIVTLFSEPRDRTRAMGAFSFVASGGGTLGVIAGGALTQAAGWRSIFLINVPGGIGVVMLTQRLLDGDRPSAAPRRLDLLGAVTVTAAVMLASAGCIEAGAQGWTSVRTLRLLAGAIVAMVVFVIDEARAPRPLIPLGVFGSRRLSVANGLAMLLRAAMFSWFFFASLYMQRVLRFSPLETGLGFLPATLMIGAFSYALTPRIVGKLGIRLPFALGAALVALGLVSFALAPGDGTFAVDMLPGMVLLGTGGGLLFMPLILAATTSIGAEHAGLAAGLLSTAQQLGGALGLAVLATLPATRTYQLAFLVSGALAAIAAVIGAALLTGGRQ